MSGTSRRDFLRYLMALSAAGLSTYLSGCKSTTLTPAAKTMEELVGFTDGPEATKPSSTEISNAEPTAAEATDVAPTDTKSAYLGVVRGKGASPDALTRRAVAAVGGIERFVAQGAEVIVKPNICNAYHGPEYASTTNPGVVGAIVAMCFEAGAKRVRVMDFPFGGKAEDAYQKSGIAQAVEAAGGQMELMNALKYQEVKIPSAKALSKTQVYADILNADVLINVPIAKHHSGAGLTLGMKNLMGVIRDRGALHANGLHPSIAELSTVVRPQLTVIDATRILVANGPTGGSLSDVRQVDTVIAGPDVVAADAYAATLFGLTGADIEYIRLGDQLGLGTLDLTAIDVEEFDL